MIPKPEPVIPKREPEIEKAPEESSLVETEPKPETPKEEIPVAAIQEEAAPVKDQGKTFWDRDLTRQTDWERFIGENLANKIGIAILVLGISFFVKFAIDKDWINEIGRVIIGLLCGCILIFFAHKTRNKYRSFSSVLVGGGLSVFYFTVAFAFHEYQLVSQQAAFFIMVVITAFAVLLSLLYDRMELAILATIGGFITPFIVSTGSDNYVALFTYLAILNSGLLVLSWFKKWRAVNHIALVFTTLIFAVWAIPELSSSPETPILRHTLIFSTIFYFQFFLMSILYNVRLNAKFGGGDFFLLLSINSLYYAVGIAALSQLSDGDYKGLFTAGLGILNLAFAWSFFKRKQADRNFVYLLIGLTLTYISLAAPVQLKGNHITLFWAAEAVVLFWLYQRSRIVLLKIASPVILVLMIISLLMDWDQVYFTTERILPLFINKGFVTGIVSALAVGVIWRMLRLEADTWYLPDFTNKTMRRVLAIVALLLLFATGACEIFYQFYTRLPGTRIHEIYLQLYTFASIWILLRYIRKDAKADNWWLVLTVLSLMLYILSLQVNYEVSLTMLQDDKNHWHFVTHWLGAGILIMIMYSLVRRLRRKGSVLQSYLAPFTWIMSLAIVFVLSVEMYHFFMWFNYRKGAEWYYWENLYYKAGLSILWGLCSFVMMWLGMKHSFRMLRIISLSLFTVTIVKLFTNDIENIPPGGKIAAFILLGVLLLIISFMYQRLKKIIIDEKEKN